VTTPDDIRRKALNLYPAFLAAWLRNEPFFPRTIPARRQPEGDLAQAAAAVQRLRAGSKEVTGCGYTVEWAEINSRTFGRNRFPARIVVETQDDYLPFIGRMGEFTAFAAAVGRIRARYPQLEAWIGAHRTRLVEAAADVEGLLQVVEFLDAHPRPGLFARELPVPVDTKFIERHHRILREWLDLVLPPQAVRADEAHFDRRFGLRYAEPHVLIRFLDDALREACGCPWPELSLPLHTLAGLPVHAHHVLIVENKVNLLTLPPMAGAVALGGLGNGVTDLRYLSWLAETAIWYWGDIDVEGFGILSRLRSLLPQTRSLFMDEGTLADWRHLAGAGSGRGGEVPPGLTPAERAACDVCLREDLRLEQERLPQAVVQTEGLRTVLHLPG
jgi:hypothetical protein